MKRVGIFSLGYSQTKVGHLCDLLHSVQSPYAFKHCGAITNLSSPDLPGYVYSDEAFQALIRPHRGNYDVCVVITSVPIEDNFFTRTVEGSLIIATFYETQEFLDASGRTPEEYAAMTICQELVSFEFQRVSTLSWQELFHPDPRGCLFDFAGIKSQKIAKLTQCSLCAQCLGQLAAHNVNEQVTNFALSLLNRIRKPSLRKALHMSTTAPGWSFVYGGLVIGTAVNLFSSVLMSDKPLTSFQCNFAGLFSLSIIVFPLAVYFWLLIGELRRRMR
jgi:hypothetical protein